jgi:hypothetical protein
MLSFRERGNQAGCARGLTRAEDDERAASPARGPRKSLGWEAGERHVLGQLLNFLMASSVTGVKRLTRLPSGSRNRMERLPQGIVVGS